MILLALLLATSASCEFYKDGVAGEWAGSLPLDHIWYSYEFNTGVGNREELVIKELKWDSDFKQGEGVTSWISVTSSPNETYAIGTMQSAITVMSLRLSSLRTAFVSEAKIIELRERPIAASALSVSNHLSGQAEVFLVVSTTGKAERLWWFRLSAGGHKLFSTYAQSRRARHIKLFRVKNAFKLLAVYDETLWRNGTLAGISDVWFLKDTIKMGSTQSLMLASSVTTSAVTRFRSETYLSIPQAKLNAVLVYRYEKNQFVPYQKLASNNVECVAAFKNTQDAYIAVGAEEASIYKMTGKGFVQEVLKGVPMQAVNHWLVMPLRTYRDDVALVAQQKIMHGTHTTLGVEIITHNDGWFTTHDETPCSYYGQKTHGLDCMVDLEVPTGIFGSTVIAMGPLVGILVPRNKLKSGLFIVHYELVERPSSLQNNLNRMVAMKARIETMFIEQEKLIRDIEYKLKKTLKPNEANYISAHWKMQDVTAETLLTKDSVEFTNSFLNLPDLGPAQYTAYFERLKEIEKIKNSITLKSGVFMPSNRNAYEFEELIVYGNVSVLGNSYLNNVQLEYLNEDYFDAAAKDIFRFDRPFIIEAPKFFANLHVETIITNYLNDVEPKNIFFDSGEQVQIHGNIIFQQPVSVKKSVELLPPGKVNGVDFKHKVIQMGKHLEDSLQIVDLNVENTIKLKHLNGQRMDEMKLSAESSTAFYDSLKIEGDITTERINGKPFDQMLNNICLLNSTCSILANVTVKALEMEQNIEIEYLNGLKFPQEYVLTSTDGFQIITGVKTFTKNLQVMEITTNGTINALNPESVITLSTAENIGGSITFSQLELTEKIEVGGLVVGSYVRNILPNPTLMEQNILKSSVVFSNIEVLGEVYVEDEFNETTLHNMIEDVIFQDENSYVINSSKEFSGELMIEDLNIKSGFFNDANIENIITADTEQELRLNSLGRSIRFKKLAIHGHLDSMNISEVDANSVKINGEQFISTSLIFEDLINGDEIRILNTINGLTPQDIFTPDGDRIIQGDLLLNDLTVDSMTVNGNFTGKISGFDIESFDRNRLSLSKNQTIESHYVIEQADVRNVTADVLNGVLIAELHSLLLSNYSKNVTQQFLAGELNVKELVVKGPTRIGTMNGHSMQQLIDNAIWTNRQAAFTQRVNVEDARFDYIVFERLNGRKFDELVNDLVRKTETKVLFTGRKKFKKRIQVFGNAFIDRLNGISFSDYLTISSDQVIKSPVNLGGRLIVEEVVVQGSINNISIGNLSQRFNIIDEKTFLIHGDVVFDKATQINQMFSPTLNRSTDLGKLLPSIISVHEASMIAGNVVFKNKIEVFKGLDTRTLNNVELSSVLPNIFIEKQGGFINGSLLFKDDVYVYGKMRIKRNVESASLNDIDMNAWKDNLIFLNDTTSKIPGTFIFDDATVLQGMNLHFINNVDVTKLLTLSTQQSIEATMLFTTLKVLSSVPVGKSVNGYNLSKELNNSLLIKGNQVIESGIIFNGELIVQNNMKTLGSVNGKDLRKVVTATTDQELFADYEFNGRTNIFGNFRVFGKLNGIELNEWHARAVLTQGKPHEINTTWTVQGNMTFMGNAKTSRKIGGISIDEFVENLKSSQNEKHLQDVEINRNFTSSCKKVENLVHFIPRTIHIFQYFENIQDIEYKNLSQLHPFEFDNRKFLLVQRNNSCFVHIFEWVSKQFIRVAEVKMESFEQIISVADAENAFFVTRRSPSASVSCTAHSTAMWMLVADEDKLMIEFLEELDDSEDLRDSEFSSVFYSKSGNSVFEYVITRNFGIDVLKTTNWTVPNVGRFLPRKLGFGLALHDGESMIRLSKEAGPFAGLPVPGKTIAFQNNIFNVLNEDTISFSAGQTGHRKRLIATPIYETTSVPGKFDSIKIYDTNSSVLFHKILTHKPSSLTFIDFGENSQELLVFLEDKKLLRVNEYKGIEGFKHKFSSSEGGESLLAITLPLDINNEGNFLIVSHLDSISILEAIVVGSRPNVQKPNCDQS